MTPKQVPFGHVEVGQEFKMSHRGVTWIKIRSKGRGLGSIYNAQAKNSPNKKIFVQSTTGVIVQL